MLVFNSKDFVKTCLVLLLTSFVVASGFCKGEKVKKQTTTAPTVVPTIVFDVEGTSYKIVQIGNQTWMKENLRTSHFQNGKLIPFVKDSNKWASQTTAAFCYYNNDTTLIKENGFFYNWYAVSDSQNICPKGWHVPSIDDWAVLEEQIGGTITAGGKMKDTTDVWLNSFGASNESGFKGLPSGCRTNKGTFNSIGYYGLWWTSTENYSSYAWYRSLSYNSTELLKHYYYKRYGFSVRCLKD